jgi:cellulose/xylan binding protein with CBM9 domain
MKLVSAVITKDFDYENELEEMDLLMDSIEKHSLDYVPWPAFSYKPEVVFSISYTSDCIMLKYYVKERCIRAVNGNTNDPVYQDSCVEFFIDFNDGKGYYNLEYNCIGTGRIGFGKDRDHRVLLSDEVVNKVKSISYINKTESDIVNWELTLVIPFSIFCHHNILSLRGISSRVNFYKCGDNLPEPHFVTWSDVFSPEPDFHMPQYYGTLAFN